jgi:YHS domain-containing protein
VPTCRTASIGLLSSALIPSLAGIARAAPGVFTRDGYALGGWDSAAYWTAKKSARGQPSFSFQWNGVNWLFASQANRDAFAADPARYAPGFNGYCPFCLAGGKLVPGLGDIWDVHKGKLYLLLSQRIKDDFIMKADYYVERATAYWAKLS